MSANRTNSYETPQTDVTDYPVLCIIMRFMSVIHMVGVNHSFPITIYTVRPVTIVDTPHPTPIINRIWTNCPPINISYY